MSYHNTSRKHDILDRTDKGVNYVGTATFVGGRLLGPFIQYGFLKYDWGRPIIRAMGGDTLPPGPPIITNTSLDRLGLSPYRSIMLAMSVGAMLKQNYWVTMICQEKIPPALGLTVSLGNVVGDLANAFLYVCAQTSASANGQHFPQTPLIIGSVMYAAGLAVEFVSEQQRYLFKRDPANKGRLYTKGLFRYSRHINMFGYALWRTGYCIAAGGYTWGAIVAASVTLLTTRKVIPPHQHYLEEKYGKQFEEYKRNTPYQLIPWIL